MIGMKNLSLLVMILVCIPSIIKAQSEPSLAIRPAITASAPGTPQAQSELSLAFRVEQSIKTKELGWKSSRGIESGRIRVVPSERTLLVSFWERKLKNDGRKVVSVLLYDVESPPEAAKWLRPIREGKIAAGWQVEKYGIGDEGYLSKFQARRRYSLHFRKDNIVVEISGESFSYVKRFAQHVILQIAAG